MREQLLSLLFGDFGCDFSKPLWSATLAPPAPDKHVRWVEHKLSFSEIFREFEAFSSLNFAATLRERLWLLKLKSALHSSSSCDLE